jgi:hypothetical protein
VYHDLPEPYHWVLVIPPQAGSAEAHKPQAPSQRHAAGLSDWSDLDREDLALAAGKSCLTPGLADPPGHSEITLSVTGETVSLVTKTRCSFQRPRALISRDSALSSAHPGILYMYALCGLCFLPTLQGIEYHRHIISAVFIQALGHPDTGVSSRSLRYPSACARAARRLLYAPGSRPAWRAPGSAWPRP